MASTDVTGDPLKEFTVAGASSLPDPLLALQAALGAVGSAMAARGATPTDLLAVSWTARRPAVVHPARMVVDLALREQFGGARPAVAVGVGDHEGVAVTARIRLPQPAAGGTVWRNFTAAELARAYSPRATVSDMPGIFEAWRREGAAFRAAHLTAELRYGPAASECVDLYLPPTGTGPWPLWVFLHGGYWQAVDKAHNAQFAAGMLAAGYAVAMPNYTLAPTLRLAGIVDETRRCIAFLAREAAALGCDPAQLHLAGHSAGGHLVAMLSALPDGELIRSCLALSGVFDLEPLAHLAMGPMLALTGPDVVAALSPVRLRPAPHIRIGVAVGGSESAEFHRQSAEFAAAWGGAPLRVAAGRNHFDLLDGLLGGELLDFALQTAGP